MPVRLDFSSYGLSAISAIHVGSNWETTTVTNASTVALPDRNAIRAAMAEIAAGCDQSEQFFTRLFDDLDALLANLAQQHQAWLDQHQSAGKESESLREQLQRFERQQAAWEQDRVAMENELEVVRNQAADLSEKLAEQKRQLETREAEWTQELREMRRLLEMMAQRQFEQHESADNRQPAACAAAAPAGGAVGDSPGEPATPDDPVLDSVMAQFQLLQKDLARRRRSS